MSGRPGKCRVINFRLTEAQYKRLMWVAALAGESVCEYARKAVFLVANVEIDTRTPLHFWELKG